MKPSNKSIVPEGSSSDVKDHTSNKTIDHHNHEDEITDHASDQQGARSSDKPRGKWTHNPVVLSLVACSTMHNCEEVKEVYRDCVANNDTDSMICEAAEKYFKMCHIDNGDASNILNFTPYVEP